MEEKEIRKELKEKYAVYVKTVTLEANKYYLAYYYLEFRKDADGSPCVRPFPYPYIFSNLNEILDYCKGKEGDN